MEHLNSKHCIWHPCTQMKDHETFPPLKIKRAYGSVIECENGHKIIDAISSWWCKSLGHNHPRLKAALINQSEQFEHVIFANTSYDAIEELSEKLIKLMPHLGKVFYAGDGSSAVEIAMKMSLHCHQLTQQKQRTKFIALKNGYHGETCGALSVSDVGIYRNAYKSILFNAHIIKPPYLNHTEDPLWDDANEHWQHIAAELELFKDTAAAIIIEPILQGSAGMKLYSKDFLQKLALFAKNNNIHIIADEIMTGIGRTGKMLASEHANIKPDFICLSKGLTSGWLPFSAVLTTDDIYQAFYDDYETGKSFLHSHTYSGNALGARVALETLNIVEEEKLCHKALMMQTHLHQHMQNIANNTGLLKNVRGIGAVIAADLEANDLPERAGFKLYQEAVKLGALLRPIGNTIYWCPPLTISENEIQQLHHMTLQAIKNCF